MAAAKTKRPANPPKRLLPSLRGGRMKDYGAMTSEIAREKVAD